MSTPFPTDQIASASAGLLASLGSPDASNRAGGLLQSSYWNMSARFSDVSRATVSRRWKSSCGSTGRDWPSIFAHDLLSMVTTVSFFLTLLVLLH